MSGRSYMSAIQHGYPFAYVAVKAVAGREGLLVMFTTLSWLSMCLASLP